MLSKARMKLIQSLSLKKQRGELKLFVVEGKKQVAELLTSDYKISCLVATQSWLDNHSESIKPGTETIPVSPDELYKASLQQAPQEVLAVVHMPERTFTPASLHNEFSIALDGIQDPGNLGTIIRIADWYGIKNIVCSHDCVDVFNPKTIQASMGSFMRVDVWYEELEDILTPLKLPVYGALMNGTSLYETRLSQNGVLLIGNEGKGISEQLLPLITNPVTIPKFGGAESLNAGIATAIICDAWAREKGNFSLR